MTQCPNCSKTIAVTEDNFGTLYRCEHCQTEFFIGFDGAPENSKEPSVPELDEDGMMDSQLAVNVISTEPPESSGAPRDIFGIDSDNQNENQNSGQNDIYAMNPPEPTPEPEEIIPPTNNVFKDFAQDVRDFGNDSVTAGVLTFDIEISGIDLGELKRDLLEALDDKRFGWSLSDLTQNIKDGKLVIKNISAPKIIVLVKRVTPIGLSLNWRHHVSTQ